MAFLRSSPSVLRPPPSPIPLWCGTARSAPVMGSRGCPCTDHAKPMLVSPTCPQRRRKRCGFTGDGPLTFIPPQGVFGWCRRDDPPRGKTGGSQRRLASTASGALRPHRKSIREADLRCPAAHTLREDTPWTVLRPPVLRNGASVNVQCPERRRERQVSPPDSGKGWGRCSPPSARPPRARSFWRLDRRGPPARAEREDLRP